jgi:RNA polymerase sigma-70 factor (ECF subfamily)
VLNESDIVRSLLKDRLKILSYLDSILSDFHLAEDCYQDVCAAAVAKVDYFEDATHMLRWSLRTGRNKAIDSLRRRDRQPCGLDDGALEALEGQWLAESSHPPDEARDRVY